jgi:hypothetical protein
MCNRLLAVLAAITVLSLAVVETTSAQQVITQSQAFSNGYGTCRDIGHVAIGLFGTLRCDGMRR